MIRKNNINIIRDYESTLHFQFLGVIEEILVQGIVLSHILILSLIHICYLGDCPVRQYLLGQSRLHLLDLRLYVIDNLQGCLLYTSRCV